MPDPEINPFRYTHPQIPSRRIPCPKRYEYKAGEVINPLDIPDDPGVSLNLRNDSIPFKGSRLPVVIMTINNNGENTEWYLSPEVSVYGLVRQVTNGKMVFDLLDYY